MVEQDVGYRREEEARQDPNIYRIKVTLTNTQGNRTNEQTKQRNKGANGHSELTNEHISLA